MISIKLPWSGCVSYLSSGNYQFSYCFKIFKNIFSFNRGEKYSKLYFCIFNIFISFLYSVCLLSIIKNSNLFHMKDRLINVSVLHNTSLKLRYSHYPMLRCFRLLIFPTLWGHRRCATDACISKPCDGLKKGCLDTKHNNTVLAFSADFFQHSGRFFCCSTKRVLIKPMGGLRANWWQDGFPEVLC